MGFVFFIVPVSTERVIDVYHMIILIDKMKRFGAVNSTKNTSALFDRCFLKKIKKIKPNIQIFF